MSKTFKIELEVVAQIPDPTRGCSASICSNCQEKVAYCHARCNGCDMPFIGPFGFPPIQEWDQLTDQEKEGLVRRVCEEEDHYGKLRSYVATGTGLKLIGF